MVSVTVGLPEVVPCSGKKSTMVGFDENLVRVMDELTSGGSNLQILPIVGMGGIGKTTLVQNAFHHPYIEHYFHKRIWFTISHEYSVREILLRQFNNGEDQESNETLVGLGERFYRSLFGERYLIIMDDVWSTKVWDDLKMFFPNNNNGSRIMLTTRESSVAISLGSYKPYVIGFLNEEKSWNLFCEKAFAQEDCPYPELEETSKNIAKSCNGLPLAIVVVGGLLGKSNMTREYWEFVAENVKAFRNSKDSGGCLKILSLSYNNLPIHLKPCFLNVKEDKCFMCGLRTSLQRIDLNEVHDVSQLTSLASVFVCSTCQNKYPSLTRATVVRVRLVKRNFLGRVPKYDEILLPTSVRYLQLNNWEFVSPSAIALLWNLETFC
ncbi:UNVERIFIED_CONTAM: putative disease resistance protein [Sesamum radiatum]|uniref:Disease resistance protein n=1 Tax=Sesamum radiatum TaxID=300843 RepID=A0AAW2WIM1_SESRA